MALRSDSRTGVAAILAGVLIFAGQAGELVFGSPSDLVDVVFVTLSGVGVAALVVAIRRLGRLVTRPWVLLLVGAAGILVAITVEDGVHDIGLFVFEGAWVAVGVALLRSEHRSPASAFALV